MTKPCRKETLEIADSVKLTRGPSGWINDGYYAGNLEAFYNLAYAAGLEVNADTIERLTAENAELRRRLGDN